MKHATLTLSLTAALAAAPSAQDLIPAAPPQTRPVLIENATVHTVTNGTLEGASILFADGRIEAVSEAGATLNVVGDAVRIDGSGRHVYPGFVAFASTMGLTEIGSVDMTLDVDEAGSVTPEARAGVAVNADSWVIPVTRRNGVLTCGVMPTGGRIPGRASVIRMDGWTWEDLALVPDAGLVLNWPGAGPFGDDDGEAKERYREARVEIDELFDAAVAYLEARKHDETVETDLRLRAMAGAVRGTSKLFVGAWSPRQIEDAVAWGVERDLDLAIVGGHGAAQCLDLLARHDVPVALAAAHRLPGRRDLSWREPYELPSRLEEAGIRWCLTYAPGSWTNANQRNLPYEAAATIPHGLSEEAALRSITLSAAELLGVGDELGSLEPGKRATLFLTDGDALEPTTNVLAAFIDGRRVDLTDKQTALDAKYREKYRQLGRLR